MLQNQYLLNSWRQMFGLKNVVMTKNAPCLEINEITMEVGQIRLLRLGNYLLCAELIKDVRDTIDVRNNPLNLPFAFKVIDSIKFKSDYRYATVDPNRVRPGEIIHHFTQAAIITLKEFKEIKTALAAHYSHYQLVPMSLSSFFNTVYYHPKLNEVLSTRNSYHLRN